MLAGMSLFNRSARMVFVLLALGSVTLLGQIHRMEWDHPYQQGKLDFLRRLLADRSVVQLGESIHMTDEFPRVRRNILQYLHEQLGFDVLAFEGSAVDSWLAQDYLYRSSELVSKKAAEAQRLAWFGLWQTDAMRGVMTYVVETQTTKKPLYLTSFDIQPGNGRAFEGKGMRALEELFHAVQAYAPPPDAAAFDRWKAALSVYFGCYGHGEPKSEEQRKAVERSLAELREWLRFAALRIRPAIHGRALGLVAESLRGTVELCSIAPLQPFGRQT
jgi:erythromycin esterase